jgi:hypothetical protein
MGLLLVVLKSEGGGDHLFVLEKVDDHFESRSSMPCGFVQMRGKYRRDGLDPAVLEETPEWSALGARECARRSFWWGGKGLELHLWQTLGIRSFLGITEPCFRVFKLAKTDAAAPERYVFGLLDREESSLVLARDDELISYGNASATERLLTGVHEWVDLGMPTAASFNLRVYPSDGEPPTGRNHWVTKGDDSQFVWSLPQ